MMPPDRDDTPRDRDDAPSDAEGGEPGTGDDPGHSGLTDEFDAVLERDFGEGSGDRARGACRG